jgi:hypothetical protein
LQALLWFDGGENEGENNTRQNPVKATKGAVGFVFADSHLRAKKLRQQA